MIAEMLHFYQCGWQELLEMDVRWFYKLYSRIQAVEARRGLALLPLLAYPHLTDAQARTGIYETLLRQSGYKRMAALAQADPDRQRTGWDEFRAVMGLGLDREHPNGHI